MSAAEVVRFVGWSLAAFVLSLGFVAVCRWLALRYGYVAKPRADRWHTKPTALLGGIAITATTLIVAAASGVAGSMGLLMAAGTLIFIVGLTDDLVSLKPSTKLIAEIAL